MQVDWCMYVSTLCIFHLSEYFLMAQYNPEELSSTGMNTRLTNQPNECNYCIYVPSNAAFILNDNPQYQLAQLFLTCEYWAEYLLVPVIKSTTTAPWSWMFWLGTVVMVVGQIIRIASISTAGYAFTHLVKPYRREDHVLVTHGIYSYLRHPGYFGWFWWSVGICITVRNPLSMVAFAYAAFRFFRFRIRHEELELLEMFGQQYEEYRSKTTVGIPGIS